MQITSTANAQYTPQVNNTANSNVERKSEKVETAPSRYETLLNMNYDNMSPSERSELSHYNAIRPVSYLDDKGNEALNKALEGKTDAEKFTIKNTMELMFTTSIKVNHENNTVEREKFSSIDINKSATVTRFEDYMENFNKLGSVDNIGLQEVMEKFLQLYKADYTPLDLKA